MVRFSINLSIADLESLDTRGNLAVANRNPLRIKQATLEQPDRHFNCRYYLRCLDTACVGRWESWCCTECNAFEAAIPEVVSNNRGQGF